MNGFVYFGPSCAHLTCHGSHDQKPYSSFCPTHPAVDNSHISPNSTWFVTSEHDMFDVLSPCILAVSTLSNSTARHVKRVVSWSDEPSGI